MFTTRAARFFFDRPRLYPKWNKTKARRSERLIHRRISRDAR